MPARLLALFAERPARDWLLRPGREYVVGRDLACDLAIDDDRISRRHATLRGDETGWTLTDLDSKNGTAIDGRRLPAAALPTALPAQAWLSFGGLPARFELLAPAQSEGLEAVRRARRQTTDGLGAHLDPRLGLDALLDRTLESLLSLVDAERAFVLLGDDPSRLEVVRSRPDSGGEFGGSRGAVERALASGRPVVAADARAVTELASRGSILEGGIRALACVPLAAGSTLGALYADSRRAGVVFTELDLQLLATLAEHAAFALAAHRMGGELSHLARDAGARRPAG